MPTSGAIMLKTARFRQNKARCGPASLKIVARYFGIDISESKLARICRTSTISGPTGANLVTAARRLGFATRIIDGADFRMITAWLRKGVPVIVDWMSTDHGQNSPVAIGHYSVVCGLTRDDIILEDPAIGRKRRLSRRVFYERVVRLQISFTRKDR